ncbi:hypothetical protein [Deinococcus maricopensis]|uniref:Lipoprotein n=1 Tax=Deinococcus maricopensis (strain DSM 21211 / LMG 22137 / NRRL B-23946 / LB-34) TaxID=709986 RepID=E8UC46_DEIML|nr:hypothetical protein [Deinococcus maricopensis]ADV68707.1 hypothetical protein Deima_3078 [Deinococcus maricopensis DSM 21211]
MRRIWIAMLPATLALTLAACGNTASTAPDATTEPGTAAPAADTPAPDLAALSGVKLSDSTARSRVRNAGIGVTSSGGCTDRYTSTCTSLEQVNSGTIDGIVTLRNASGCSITITGGTEVGHASGTYSHWNGYKLDISKNSCIASYITNSFTRIANRGDGAPQYKSAAGNIYADEYWANHWDILYY